MELLLTCSFDEIGACFACQEKSLAMQLIPLAIVQLDMNFFLHKLWSSSVPSIRFFVCLSQSKTWAKVAGV